MRESEKEKRKKLLESEINIIFFCHLRNNNRRCQRYVVHNILTKLRTLI